MTCVGQESRIGVVASGYDSSPYPVRPRDDAAALRQHYRLRFTRHVEGLSVFVLVRT